MVRWCWVNIQCRGVYSRARTTVLAVCAEMGAVWIFFFSHMAFLSSFSLSLEDSLIWTEILSQRALSPKQQS